MKKIPKREKWLYKNKKAFQSVRRGLKQAKDGKLAPIPEIPMMEQKFALKLVDKIIERFSAEINSPYSSSMLSIKKQLRASAILAISDVYAIVPDGYKSRKKTSKMYNDFLKTLPADRREKC